MKKSSDTYVEHQEVEDRSRDHLKLDWSLGPCLEVQKGRKAFPS